MTTCPYTKEKCDATCGLYVANRGCASKVLVEVTAAVCNAVREMTKAVDDLSLQLIETTDVIKGAEKKAAPAEHPRHSASPATDEEIDRFCESVNPLELANMPVKNSYTMFRRWCRDRTIEPCSQAKLTRRMCSVHGFTSLGGCFRPIRRGV